MTAQFEAPEYQNLGTKFNQYILNLQAEETGTIGRPRFRFIIILK